MNKRIKIIIYCCAAILFSVLLTGCSYDSSNNNNLPASTGIKNTNQSPSIVTPSQSQPSAVSAPTYKAPSFHGYTCSEDCSGHEAGYDWAEENDITDPGDCDGNSQSFIEGCESYAEENSYESDDYSDDDYEDDYF